MLLVGDGAGMTLVLSWWYWKGVYLLLHLDLVDVRGGTDGRAMTLGAVRTSACGSA